MAYRRVLTVQDISCVGQCSLTVALPVLSACGQETCVLPSAVLSNHTGGFRGNTFRDLSDDFVAISKVWQENSLSFDAVYTGYLGREETIHRVAQLTPGWRGDQGILIVDPAMADHGRLYKGLDVSYGRAMGTLCASADILLPNLTEACMLAGREYEPDPDTDFVEDLLCRLDNGAGRCIVLTGAVTKPDSTGVAVRSNGKTLLYTHRKIEGSFHGTGDLFAAAFVGAYLQGREPFDAAVIAADFVALSVEKTCAAPAHRYGVKFETALAHLMAALELLPEK